MVWGIFSAAHTVQLLHGKKLIIFGIEGNITARLASNN